MPADLLLGLTWSKKFAQDVVYPVIENSIFVPFADLTLWFWSVLQI